MKQTVHTPFTLPLITTDKANIYLFAFCFELGLSGSLPMSHPPHKSLLERSWLLRSVGQTYRRPVCPEPLVYSCQPAPTSKGQPAPVPLSGPFTPFPHPDCSQMCPHFISIQLKKTFIEQPLNAGTCAGAHTQGQ